MATSPNSQQHDLDALRQAILAFSAEHRQRQFGVLREVGVQAALKRLADCHLGTDTTVDATLVDEHGQSIIVPATGLETVVNTDRVRLESKILLPDGPKSSVRDEESGGGGKGKSGHDRTDLLLYQRRNVQLVRYRNGPGDIVYRSFSNSVLAAMEIKADPSHTSAQKKGYGKDIVRLLMLRSLGIAGFFVILDKSSPFYGHFTRRRPFNCINWEPVPGEATSLAQVLSGGAVPGANYSAWTHIMVSRDKPKKGTCIEIYNVSVEDEAKIKYYAYDTRRGHAE